MSRGWWRNWDDELRCKNCGFRIYKKDIRLPEWRKKITKDQTGAYLCPRCGHKLEEYI